MAVALSASQAQFVLIAVSFAALTWAFVASDFSPRLVTLLHSAVVVEKRESVPLSVPAFIVFEGTIWPLVAEIMFVRKLSVDAPFFNKACTPLMVLPGLVPSDWDAHAMEAGQDRACGDIACAGAHARGGAWPTGLLAWAEQTGQRALGPVGLFLGTWPVMGAAVDLWGGRGWCYHDLVTRI